MSEALATARARAAVAAARPAAAPAVVAFVILIAPQLIADDPYRIGILTNVAMFATASLGAWLLMETGLFSFGQGIFGSIGAYVTAIMAVRHGTPFIPGLLLGASAAMLFAAVVAYPAMRTREVSFSILTLVGLLAVNQFVILTPDLTGAGAGLVVPPPAPFTVLGVTVDMAASEMVGYYVAATLLLLCLATMGLIKSSPFGRTLRALAERETLAGAVGVNIRRYRATALVTGAFFTGAAGAFSASYLQVAHPRVWHLFPSIFIVTYAIIGGRQSVLGPLVGALLVIGGTSYMPEGSNLQDVIVGIALILVVLFFPNGVIGAVRAAQGHLAAAMARARR